MAIPWHRIFGMAWTLYLEGTAWKVDTEVDLSVKQQRLDLVVLRHASYGPEPNWPDGFGTPASFNLLTFKALQDPLDAWALKELAAHGVNFRKQASPDRNQLLPEDEFRLLAASMHYPRGLAERITLRPQSPGAYDVTWGTDTIRILVMHELPEADQNLVWNLFSGDRDRIERTVEHLRPQRSLWSSILNHLLENYGLEGIPMPYTMEDFEREVKQEVLSKLTPEQRLEGLSPEQLLAHLTPEQLLAHLTPEQQLAIENHFGKQKTTPDQGSS